MMLLSLPFLFIVFVIGTIAAEDSDIDINRIYLLPDKNSQLGLYSSEDRRGSVSDIKESHLFRKNAYDDRSSSGYHSRPKSQRLRVPSIYANSTDKQLKVHPPREDPRLFYQSDAYLKEDDRHHINHEVSFIYPGREVNRATETSNMFKSMPLRLQDMPNTIDGNDINKICIKCPHDRTLIVQSGSKKVRLLAPRLFSCSGHKAPRNFRFVHMYGPSFGSLLEEGSHQIIGKIVLKNKTNHLTTLTLCKMQVHVIMHSCATPKQLISHCKEHDCTFTCRDSKADLYGQSSLMCGSDNKWIGELPICRARTWCDQPLPPEHGRVSCIGATVGAFGQNLVEGSKCKLRCTKGWRWHPRAVSVCRGGKWTNALTCQKTLYHRKSKLNKK